MHRSRLIILLSAIVLGWLLSELPYAWQATDRNVVSSLRMQSDEPSSRTAQLAMLRQVVQAPPGRGLDGRGLDGRGLDSAQVDAAIKRGMAYLWLIQKDDGGWSEYQQHNCGVTALVTLALLNCGENPDSAKMRKALNYLRQKPPEMTYSVALQAMVFCALANKSKEDMPLIERNCRWLAERQKADGSWSYPTGNGDASNSQFALLALHEGQRVGVRLNNDPAANLEAWNKCFTKAEAYWHTLQKKDGGFTYGSGESDGRGSMTCAGIASLVITASALSSLEAQAQGDSVKCCGGSNIPVDPEKPDRNMRLQQALQWLGTHFSVTTNPETQGWHFYYLYALERVGRMTGNRFIGNADWYREGAAQLLSQQVKGDGMFQSHSLFESDMREVNTAFALLFLSKGKRQVVISRLQHADRNNRNASDWNLHRQSIQHLTMATESVWKRDLAWQTVDLNRATLADLLETPVLFISGSEALTLSRGQQDMLRDYVRQGGFIFAEACNEDGCKGEKFTRDFQRFVAETFDQPLEKLSPDHPLWSVEARVDPKALPHDFWLYGVQDCCRLGLVFSPVSLSCRWELNAPYGVKAARSPKLQAELDNAMKIGVNVLSYATGKQLKEKLDAVSILDGLLPAPPSDRGTLIIPKLQHGGGSNDAPRALTNLLLWLDRENPFEISNENRTISITDDELQKYPIVFMHGRGNFRFSEAQRQSLRTYLENGGFLFADAICANEEFAASFHREFDLILPGRPLEKLAANHAMLTNVYRGYDCRQLTILDPTPTEDKLLTGQRKITPQLEVIRSGELISVVFSPLDMSCALESRHSLQCRGYLREDAAKLGINIILFALQQ